MVWLGVEPRAGRMEGTKESTSYGGTPMCHNMFVIDQYY